jgi:hypothetical protein
VLVALDILLSVHAVVCSTWSLQVDIWSNSCGPLTQNVQLGKSETILG